ncbi:MAG TPA: Fur family transcriptional regulator [Syntrophomonadaceae bacterium]|nr:Fur family transcriptional regulator [Syntrophomonadaceae bacterium]
MNLQLENLADELEQRNIRPSYQRIKILEYLISNQHHQNAEQIFNDLRGEIPTLSKTTVYNNLNLFAAANLVRIITIDDNEARFDINTDNHGHFICEACGFICTVTISRN